MCKVKESLKRVIDEAQVSLIVKYLINNMYAKLVGELEIVQ